MKLEEIFSSFAECKLELSDNIIPEVRKYLMDICGPEGFSIGFSNPVVATDSLFVSATITVTGEDGKSHTVTALGAQTLKEGNRFIANSTRYVQNDALKNACLLLGAGGEDFAESFGEKKEKTGHGNGQKRTYGKSRGNDSSGNKGGTESPTFSVKTKGAVKDCFLKKGAKQLDVILDGQTLNLIFWPDKIEALGNVFNALVERCKNCSTDFKLKAKDNRPNYNQLIFQEFVK